MTELLKDIAFHVGVLTGVALTMVGGGVIFALLAKWTGCW
jgi:hypothetical protein